DPPNAAVVLLRHQDIVGSDERETCWCTQSARNQRPLQGCVAQGLGRNRRRESDDCNCGEQVEQAPGSQVRHRAQYRRSAFQMQCKRAAVREDLRDGSDHCPPAKLLWPPTGPLERPAERTRAQYEANADVSRGSIPAREYLIARTHVTCVWA